MKIFIKEVFLKRLLAIIFHKKFVQRDKDWKMSRRRGRINISQRDTDDVTTIIGSNLRLSNNHITSVRDTEKHSKELKTIRDHCNRLKEMVK